MNRFRPFAHPHRISNRPLRAGLSLIAAGALATLAACGGGGGGSSSDTRQVSIRFIATAGDTAIDCSSTLSAIGTAGSTAKLADLRVYLSDITLVNSDGVEVPVTLDENDHQLTEDGHTVVLLDFEDATGACYGDAATYTTITGTVPEGEYDEIHWTLGVPEALNHSETTAASAPLDNADMAWNWQYGRKFAKVELNPENPDVADDYTQGVTQVDADGNVTGASDTFYFHLGNTGCEAGATAGEYTCTSDNTRAMHIHDFDMDAEAITVDVKALFAQSAIDEDHGGAPGCMSGADDPECIAMWGVIGSSFDANGDSVVDDDSEFLHGHTVFRKITP